MLLMAVKTKFTLTLACIRATKSTNIIRMPLESKLSKFYFSWGDKNQSIVHIENVVKFTSQNQSN